MLVSGGELARVNVVLDVLDESVMLAQGGLGHVADRVAHDGDRPASGELVHNVSVLEVLGRYGPRAMLERRLAAVLEELRIGRRDELHATRPDRRVVLARASRSAGRWCSWCRWRRRPCVRSLMMMMTMARICTRVAHGRERGGRGGHTRRRQRQGRVSTRLVLVAYALELHEHDVVLGVDEYLVVHNAHGQDRVAQAVAAYDAYAVAVHHVPDADLAVGGARDGAQVLELEAEHLLGMAHGHQALLVLALRAEEQSVAVRAAAEQVPAVEADGAHRTVVGRERLDERARDDVEELDLARLAAARRQLLAHRHRHDLVHVLEGAPRLALAHVPDAARAIRAARYEALVLVVLVHGQTRDRLLMTLIDAHALARVDVPAAQAGVVGAGEDEPLALAHVDGAYGADVALDGVGHLGRAAHVYEAHLVVERAVGGQVGPAVVHEAVRIALLLEQEHVVGAAEHVALLDDHVARRVARVGRVPAALALERHVDQRLARIQPHLVRARHQVGHLHVQVVGELRVVVLRRGALFVCLLFHGKEE